MDSITSLNLKRNIQESRQREKLNAVWLDHFYSQDHEAINFCLRTDLSDTYALEDVGLLKGITIDFFIARFLQQRLNVYNTPPVFKFTDKAGQKDKDRFSALMEEVEIGTIMQDNGYKCLLHNTILAHVKYNVPLKKVFIENDYNISNTEVVTYEGYNYEPAVIAYENMLKNQFVHVVWDREAKEHYILTGDFKYNEVERQVVADERDKIPVPGNKDIKLPKYWPWVVYRAKKQNAEFWGNGLTSLVELNRIINILLTICGDDIINETIAVWLYNFNPSEAGNKRSDGRIKVGFRNPLWHTPGMTGTQNPSVQVARADLFVADILAFIEALTGLVSSMHGIDNIMKAQLKEDLAGVAIRLRNEPLMRQWEEDIRYLKPSDINLIKAVVEVNNEERPETFINPKILDELTIDYQQPKVVTDEKEEWELVLSKAPKGADSVVEYVMKRNPELSEQEAIEKIKDRIEEWDELFGSKFNISLEVENEDQRTDNSTDESVGENQEKGETNNNGGTEKWDAKQRSGEKENNGENEGRGGNPAAKG